MTHKHLHVFHRSSPTLIYKRKERRTNLSKLIEESFGAERPQDFWGRQQRSRIPSGAAGARMKEASNTPAFFSSTIDSSSCRDTITKDLALVFNETTISLELTASSVTPQKPVQFFPAHKNQSKPALQIQPITNANNSCMFISYYCT